MRGGEISLGEELPADVAARARLLTDARTAQDFVCAGGGVGRAAGKSSSVTDLDAGDVVFHLGRRQHGTTAIKSGERASLVIFFLLDDEIHPKDDLDGYATLKPTMTPTTTVAGAATEATPAARFSTFSLPRQTFYVDGEPSRTPFSVAVPVALLAADAEDASERSEHLWSLVHGEAESFCTSALRCGPGGLPTCEECAMRVARKLMEQDASLFRQTKMHFE